MKILSFLYFLLLKLRYNFIIKWIENIDKNKKYLVFPNHQALVDPQIVVSIVGQKINLSPVISETYYNLPVLKYFFKLMWAVPMGDLQRWTSNTDDIKKSFENINNSLKSWRNILLYPAWQLYSQWYEVIKWKKSAFNLVQSLDKETQILVIRTTWLWWSMWSKSWNWNTPNMIKTLFKAIFILIWNLIIFTPKRQVNITIENYTNKLKNIKDINKFNEILENFYNQNWNEEINYKKHFFYFDNTKNKSIPKISWSIESTWNKIDEKLIPEVVKEKIIAKICEIKNIKIDNNLSLEKNLILDFYFDSLDAAEIKAFIQNNFEKSSNPPITDLKTVWDLCYMAIWKSSNVESLKPCEWSEVKSIFNLVQNLR